LGSASFDNVTATAIARSTPIYNCAGNGFQITRTGTNTGWFTAAPACGGWPAPIWKTTTP
jgi:hypothetical protein